jgi:hypothetical protein
MLDSLTTELGDTIREFVTKTCSKFDTKELSREYQARMRREAKRKGKKGAGKGAAKGDEAANEAQSPVGEEALTEGRLEDDEPPTKRQKTLGKGSSAARKHKTLNLNTYKFHSLGDVVPTIRMFGTTDSYSTQMVSP